MFSNRRHWGSGFLFLLLLGFSSIPVVFGQAKGGKEENSTGENIGFGIQTVAGLSQLPECTVEIQGHLFYLKTLKEFQYCDGQGFKSIDLAAYQDPDRSAPASVRWLGALKSVPTNPGKNDAYYNITDGFAHVWDGEAWQMPDQFGSSALPYAEFVPPTEENDEAQTQVIFKEETELAPTNSKTPQLAEENPLSYDQWDSQIVQDGAWGTAKPIEDAKGDAYNPQIALDAEGNALAVWHQSDETRFNIYANRYIFGKGWEKPQLLETQNAGNAQFPQIAVDSAGNAIVVWEQDDGIRKNIYASRYSSGQGWGKAQLIENSDFGGAQNPQVAMDIAGNAIAVWYQGDDKGFNIYSNRYTFGIGWGKAQPIEDDAGTAAYPRIAVDLNGNAMAVWYQFDGTRYNIHANRYTFGRGWGKSYTIEAGDGNAYDPEIAINAAGEAVAVWRQFDGRRNSIYSNWYFPGQGWGKAQLIEDDSAGNAAHPQIALDGNGNALAVWHQSDDARDNIWFNRYTSKAGWGKARTIEEKVGDANYPDIAMDSSGKAIVVWQQYEGTRQNIAANRFSPATGWEEPQLIEIDSAGDATLPQIAMHASGNAIAVWFQHDGSKNNILANRYTFDTSWSTPQLIEEKSGNAGSPQVAMDFTGNAIAVWHQPDGSKNSIWANRYNLGTGWEKARLIEQDDTGSAQYPQIASDAEGNAIVVWYQRDRSRYNIWANHYHPGKGWENPLLLENNNEGNAYDPRIAINNTGIAIVTWHQFDGARDNIWAAIYSPGSGWGKPILVEENNSGNARYPQVAVNTAGNGVVVWKHHDGTRYNIWARYYTFISGWEKVQLIGNKNTAGDAGNPRVAIDASGNAIAVWSQSDGIRDNIWANRYSPGTGWESPCLIEMDDAGSAVSPDIAVNASGNAITVWSQSDGAQNNIWAKRYTPGGGWGLAQQIENEDGNASSPRIAVNSAGTAMAVWYHNNGARENIWANRFTVTSGWEEAQLIENNNAGDAFDPHLAVDFNGNAIVVWHQHDGLRTNIYTNCYD